MRRLLRSTRSEQGQALAELALVLPILMLILVGIVELGHAVSNWNVDTNTASVAARYAVVGKLPTSGSCGGTKSFAAFITCEAENAGAKNVTSCVSIPNAEIGQPVEVKVHSKYRWISYLSGALNLESSTTLTGSATMRLEQVPPESLGYQTGKCA